MSRLSALWALPPIALGVATAIWFVSNAPEPAQLDTEAPGPAVRVRTITPTEIRPVAHGWGSVRPATRWTAIAEVRGQIVWRHPDLEAGRLISAGTEVMRIDPSDYELAIAQARADAQALAAEAAQLAAEQANTERVLALETERLRLAEADQTRIDGLVTQGVNPQTRADEAERAVLAARRTVTELTNSLALMPARRARIEAQQARTEAALARAERDLSHTRLSAPFDMRVTRVNAERFQPVSVGQVLIEGDALDQVEVVVQVPVPAFQRLLAPLHLPGDTLSAMRAGPAELIGAELHPIDNPGQVWAATVTRVEGMLDPKARTVPVVVTVEAPYDGAAPPLRLPLVPNMQVEVTLRGAPLADVITVPEAALHGDDIYLVTEENRLQRRPVSVAFRQDGQVTLREGLAAGERIVLDDLAPAFEGMALTPIEDTP